MIATYNNIPIQAVGQLHDRVYNAIRSLPDVTTVLDVACGFGALSQRLIDSGYRVSGIDLMPYESIQCTDLMAYYELNLNHAWSSQVNSKSGLFDIVVSLETIEHLENPRLFFREAAACVKRGGHIILSTPNVDSLISKLWFMYRNRFVYFSDWYYKTSGHITPVFEFQVRQICSEQGLSIKKILYLDHRRFDFLSDCVIYIVVKP